jgi:pyruvate/2-oxoglutarate dehydrogenase complex dihydrolipoamide acyltransferase (E2) component
MPRQFKVTVNGREYDVSVLELTAGQSAPSAAPAADAAARQAGRHDSASAGRRRRAVDRGGWCRWRRRRGRRHGWHRRRGPRQGRSDGGRGDRLMVLEAMKMKTPVMATRAGQVTRVLVAPGDPVEGGQPLLTIA